jgi:hypothetical protein
MRKASRQGTKKAGPDGTVSQASPNGVINPPYYDSMDGSHIDCQTAQKAMLGVDGDINYRMGCALKYLWRFRFKGSARQDLMKCIEYLHGILRYAEPPSGE